MIDRTKLIEKLNGLCWAARRYGHDDYGLDDWGVDVDGHRPSDGEYADDWPDLYHPEAVRLADDLLEELG